jgi:hypothetical protein
MPPAKTPAKMRFEALVRNLGTRCSILVPPRSLSPSQSISRANYILALWLLKYNMGDLGSCVLVRRARRS